MAPVELLTPWQSWCAVRPGRAIPNYDADATAEDGMWFDATAADAAIEFIAEGCVHIHDPFAGQPIILEPWQEAIVGALFGWKRTDGTRRYRESFIEVSRKNGKSTLIACIIIVMMFLDGERGAELYSAAADAKQAAIIFRMVATMIERSPFLQDLATIHRGMHQVYLNDDRATFYQSLSAEAGTKHGLNAHFVVMDELHAQEKPDLYEVLRTSMGTRRQPLFISITTADFVRPSLCNDRESLAVRICSGEITMPEFLPVVYKVGIDEDWHDEAIWYKANPNLGVSVSLEYLRQRHAEAAQLASRENEFKRLHLCMKTQTDVRWLSMEDWQACGGGFPESAIEGVRCWGGLDLSTTTDITAFVLVFAPEDEESPVYCKAWLWMPEDYVQAREKRDGVPYSQWVRKGFIEKTPGNVVDQKHIEKRVAEISHQYRVQDIAFDPHQAAYISQQLQDEHGLTMIEMRQGIPVMNGPCKELETLVTSHRIRHGDNEAMTWMAGNAVVKQDADGKIKIRKDKDTGRVDGIVALAMAIGRLQVGGNRVETKSYLETEEVLMI